MEYARKPQHGITLKDLVSYGENPTSEQWLQSARFLYNEMPIRLAKRVRELESLPYGLGLTQPVRTVTQWYTDSFRDFISTSEPENEKEEAAFTEMVERILERHTNVVPLIAAGVIQLKNTHGDDVVKQCPFLQDFLNRFYASRIGIRLLLSQHCALHHPSPDFIGTISMHMNPILIARSAASDARQLCEREYGVSPDVVFEGVAPIVAFVPSNLHHILFELYKNSMRAVVEFHGSHCDELPPIRTVIVDDDKEFVLRVSDQGGGIPRKDMPRIWSYLHTTAKSRAASMIDEQGNVSKEQDHDMYQGGHGGGQAPMAGLGFGLPLSRVFARYWGGDLQVVSIQSYGTDAYVFLSKLGNYNLLVD